MITLFFSRSDYHFIFLISLQLVPRYLICRFFIEKTKYKKERESALPIYQNTKTPVLLRQHGV